MKKMKKILSVFLAVLMTLSVASVAVSAEEGDVECTHEYGRWIISVDESCTEDGIKIRECGLCGHVDTDFIRATGHTFGTEGIVVPPTCGSVGYTIYTCTKCDETKRDTEVPALAHTYGEWAVIHTPTCTSEGLKQKVCSVCDETATGHALTEVIPALGHNYVVSVVAPSYEADGYTLHDCSRCDHFIKDNFVAKLKGEVISFELGDKITLTYEEVKPIDLSGLKIGGEINITKAFKSDAENIATVDQNGNITGKGMGKTTITCTITDEYGNVFTDTVEVQVNFSFMNWLEVIWGILKAAVEIVLGGLDFSSLLQLIPGLNLG